MIIAMEQSGKIMKVVRKAMGFICHCTRFDSLRELQDFPDKRLFRGRYKKIHSPVSLRPGAPLLLGNTLNITDSGMSILHIVDRVIE
jgi:hypothetical protein